MKTVLVIDDEEKLRSLLSRILKSEGFEVLEAGDCKTGMKKLEQNEVDDGFTNSTLEDIEFPSLGEIEGIVWDFSKRA